MPAVIGSLRADLSASVAQFEDDMRRAAAAMGRFGRDAQRIGQQITAAGQSMTVGLTAPLGAFLAFTARTGGDFEAVMNRVQVATGATTQEFQQLQAQARAFGADRRFSATAREAAEAMETLAKNGVSTQDILNGAARATLTLASATGSSLDQAADLTSSTMAQFHRQVGQMEGDVNQVTGTLLVSRLGFDDYRLAVGQAGGAAGAAGVSFQDFNAVLAATAPLFSSGSDAGTSFKTFLQRLTPQSDQARRTMQQLGLSFYDASGRLLPMAEIAQRLHDRLGPLSDRTRQLALTQIFGADAQRTAIGLMNASGQGIENFTRQIATAAPAQEQMATRMRGLNGAVQNFRKALEALMLAVADSGLLAAMTGLVNRVTDLVESMAHLPRPVLAIGAAIAGLLAVVGPFLVALGFVIQGLGRLAVLGPIVAGAIGLITRATLALVATPVGAMLTVLAIVLAVVINRMNALHQPTRQVTEATNALSTATAAYTTAANAAAGASGQARTAALAEAAARREQAIQARNAAAAQLQLARATLALIRTQNAQAINADRNSFRGDRPGTILPTINEGRATQAQANIDRASQSIADADRDIANADRVLQAGAAVAQQTQDTGTDIANLGERAEHQAAGAARRIARARRELEEALRGMQATLRYGLTDQRPQSAQRAEELSNQLRDIEERARDAGVATGAFAGTIAHLRARIEELRLRDMNREVADFGLEVHAAENDIARFAHGGLSPLDEALEGVDAQFDQLEHRLRDMIDANEALAAQSPEAARSLVTLRRMYADLSDASRRAAAAATAHQRALEAMQHTASTMDLAKTSRAIGDLRQARGDFGTATAAAREHQAITRDLEDQRLQSLQRLQELEDQLAQARQRGDEAAVRDLEEQVAAQRQLHDVAMATTTAQIQAQQRLQALSDALENSLRDSLSDLFYGLMTEGRRFDAKAWAQSFLQKITRAVADNWAQGLTDQILGFLGIGRQMRVQTIIAGSIVGGNAGGPGAGIPGGPVVSSIFNTVGHAAMNVARSVWAALPGFASGFTGMVGGAGGIDSQLVAFRGTPGEAVRVGDEPPNGRHVEVNINLDGASGDEHIRRIAYQAAAQGAAHAIDTSREALPGAQINNDLLGTP